MLSLVHMFAEKRKKANCFVGWSIVINELVLEYYFTSGSLPSTVFVNIDDNNISILLLLLL